MLIVKVVVSKNIYFLFLQVIKHCFFQVCTKNNVSAKYCYITHELRLHQNDRCKRFTPV